MLPAAALPSHRRPSPARPRGARALPYLLLVLGVLLLAWPTLVRADDGSQIVGWGSSANGALGAGFDGPTVAVPTLLSGTDAATGAAVGAGRSFLVTPDGLLASGTGPLGLGTAASASSFTPVPGTAGATQVAAGTDATLVLQADGSVAGFGTNKYGGAGSGTLGAAVLTPTPVAGLPSGVRIVQVAAGTYASLARAADGSVWSWGGVKRASNGQAVGVAGDTVVPQAVALPAGRQATEIAAGTTHALALLDDGSVWAWGATNGSGQIGNGTTGATAVAPVEVIAPPAVGQPRVATISAGAARSFAVLDDGSFRAWGASAGGGLGLGQGEETAGVPLPTAPNPNLRPAFPSYPKLVRIEGGALTTYGLGRDGRVYAWGRNDNGQLGAPSYAYAFPFDGTVGGTPGQTSTEIPQRVGALKGVPWLATGATGARQLLRTDKTLRLATVGEPTSFLGQPLGTLGGAHTIRLRSADDPSTVERIRIVGPNARDFLVVGTEGDVALPRTLVADGQIGVDVRFAPSALGERTASLVVETAGETVTVPLDGFGEPLPGNIAGLPGLPGVNGLDGAKGRDGADGGTARAGTIGFAAVTARTTVKRGRTASLPLLLVNGTDATLAATAVTATVPASLRVRSGRRTTVPATASGRSRTLAVRLRIGSRARVGTHKVRLRLKVGTTTATRTVQVRVTR